MRLNNINPILALAFTVGLFISLWLLVLAEIARRILFLRAATEKSSGTIHSRHQQDRIDWNDYHLSLSFETRDGATVYCPNHAVTKQEYETATTRQDNVTILLHVPNEPRQCLLQSQFPFERRLNTWLLVVAMFGTVVILSLLVMLGNALLLTMAAARPTSFTSTTCVLLPS